MTSVDFWSDGVQVDEAQVWEDANGVHEMGHLNRDDRVHVIELYPDDTHTWARFDDIEPADIVELYPFDDQYKEWWVKVDAFYADDGPEEPPTEPEPEFSDAELGAALRLLRDFLRS